jgi:uncharacterized membrane-anchored protein
MTTLTSANVKRALLRVPEVTLVFWIIKTLSTTVGETGADFLAFNLGWGMPVTSLLMAGIMVVLLYLQFAKFQRYVPANYWSLVVLTSVLGTLITDILVDLAGVSLVTLSVVFTALMLTGFYLWYREEGTLSIHSIDSGKREAWYWVVILMAFALGTGVGDLISEHYALGYDKALTRPLGASLGDFMIQTPADGGLGFNTMMVNVAFLTAIVSLVGYEFVRVRQALSGVPVEAGQN